MLAAPKQGELEALVQRSERLAKLLGSALEEAGESGHEHGGKDHGHGGGPRPPDVFLMGVDVMDEDFWKKACEHTSRGTWSKTGRPHERAIYDEIFAPEPNRHDRSDGDLMVLFFCGESLRPMPDKYRNLLPRSWASIEAALKKGETVELTGRARGLEVVVLGAPTRSGLSGLLERTAALAPYRPESLASSGPSIGLPAGSRYVVTFDADTPRTATVRLELATASGSIVLAMAEGARHAGGYEHWLRSLSAKDERGGAFDVQGGDGHGYRLDLDGRPATVEYQVVLEHDSSPWPEGGPDEAPYATAEDVFWTGRALFLHADHAGVEVEFRLPRGWHVSAPWEAVSGRRNVFRVADERELTEAFLLAGSHAQAEVRSGEAEILLAVGRGIDDEGRGLREVVQRILDRCRDLFGGTPPGRKLLVANRDPRGRSGSLNGGVFGNSISLLSDRAFGSESTGSWAPFVAHELVHLWNGGAGLRPSGNQYWFSEGFTEYYAHVLAARLGLEDRAAFLERVRSACQAYLAHAGSVSLREAEGRELQYDGGFLAALTLDLRLRARKPSGHGLDDLMRALFARFGTAGRPYSLEDVAALAAELAGDDLERFFERHVAGTEPLPLEQDLAAAGLRFASAVASRLPEKGYAIHEVLHIRSLTETPEGLLVRKSAAAGYQDGDRLVAIGGQTVRTFGDVQRTLTDSEPGQSVSVELVRGSSTVTLPLVLGGREDPPLEHAVETSLEAGADTALLDAILGG